jgi:hypothetical protein
MCYVDGLTPSVFRAIIKSAATALDEEAPAPASATAERKVKLAEYKRRWRERHLEKKRQKLGPKPGTKLKAKRKRAKDTGKGQLWRFEAARKTAATKRRLKAEAASSSRQGAGVPSRERRGGLTSG